MQEILLYRGVRVRRIRSFPLRGGGEGLTIYVCIYVIFNLKFQTFIVWHGGGGHLLLVPLDTSDPMLCCYP